MKQLKCEMCGSADLVKQDGMFVCQVCGTKYSLEEAKKMMIEGTVDVTGSTVKVDNSDELSNLYQIARRAKDDNNGENAAKYYDMILVKDPTSWEASFYVVYFKAMECRIAEIRSAAVSITNCLDSVLDLIKDNVKAEKEQKDAVMEVAARCMLAADALYHGAINSYNGSSKTFSQLQDMLNRCCAAINIFYFAGDKIDSRFEIREELHGTVLSLWKTGILRHNNILRYLNREQNCAEIMRYAQQIQKYEPTYQPPEAKTGGCYVATCVYGSYDCPEVWTLRRYRDNVLGSTRRGRAFIRCYYAVSPTLVKWFGRTKWFKKMWRKKLDKMVHNLQEQGIEDTPYEDIDWQTNARSSQKER